MVNAGFGWTVDDPQAQGRLGYGSMERVCNTLDELLSDGRSYILGEQFSTADIYLDSQIIWVLRFKLMDRRPALSNHGDRLMARPALIRARELDDQLLANDVHI